MPSLCSSRSTFRPGLSLRTRKDLIAARPSSLSSVAQTTTLVGALAGGDVDLLAVDDVLVAVLDRRGGDVGGVRADAGLGDRHRRPGAACSARAAPRWRPTRWRSCPGPGAASTAAARCRPSTSRRRRGPRRGWRRCGPCRCRRRRRVTSYAARAGAAARPRLGHAVDQRGEHVELLGVRVLGAVVLAGDRPEHVHRQLVGLVDERRVLLRGLEVDHQTSTAPSMTPTARRSRYHRSTGCSLTKPWPPRSWTPSRPIRMPFSVHS